MERFSAMFVLVSAFVAGSIGATGGFVMGGLVASGKVGDLEARVYLLERLIAELSGAPAGATEMADFA
uniref:hypothetical protein n=1 Tax=uncultured Sphingomonas sp. TaxID=158754 RepID=UPI0035CC7C19